MPFAKVRPGDELAKMLGESALLADLGPLLRMKQAMRQVNSAALGWTRDLFCRRMLSRKL